MDLRNQYRAVTKEIRRYNNFKSSQSRSTALEQPFRRPNLDMIQPDTLEIEDESTHSWKLGYSTINRSGEASDLLSTWSRRKRLKTSEADFNTRRDLESIMRELQELKRV